MGAQPGFDNNVLVALIAAIAGIITTWLTVKYKDRVIRKTTSSKPRDRMDTIFDGYERLILQQQTEIERKQGVISSLEDIIDKLEHELETTRSLLSSTKAEMAETRRTNTDLKHHLTRLRKEYEPHALEN